MKLMTLQQSEKLTEELELLKHTKAVLEARLNVVNNKMREIIYRYDTCDLVFTKSAKKD